MLTQIHKTFTVLNFRASAGSKRYGMNVQYVYFPVHWLGKCTTNFVDFLVFAPLSGEVGSMTKRLTTERTTKRVTTKHLKDRTDNDKTYNDQRYNETKRMWTKRLK
jgi:hypothetical protein